MVHRKLMKAFYQLVEYLKQKKITIATAESCTGGLIAKLITDVPGSSRVFIGGVVSYSNAMKMKWLGVKKETLEKFGAVSENTVKEMLTGILQATGSDLAVAVSGIAGPTGGTKDKPVGTVYIGVFFNNEQLVKRYLFHGSRDRIRTECAKKVVELIRTLCNKYIKC